MTGRPKSGQPITVIRETLLSTHPALAHHREQTLNLLVTTINNNKTIIGAIRELGLSISSFGRLRSERDIMIRYPEIEAAISRGKP